MDVNDLRVAVTLVSLVLFVALMLHTWSRRRRADHDEAAMLPFSEDRAAQAGANPSRGENT
jgi:cytochrome c oxidase cbb3-type subunit 4